MNIHNEEKSNLCTNCGILEKLYQYRYCDKACMCNSNLKVHLNTHNGEKPYIIYAVSVTSLLSQNFTLKRHEYTQWREIKPLHALWHIREKLYQCRYCDKACMCNSNLKVHLNTHNGEKPYICSQCDKSFITEFHFKKTWIYTMKRSQISARIMA